MTDIGVAGFCAVCGKAVLWNINGNIKTMDGIIDGLDLDDKLGVTKPGRYLHHSCYRSALPEPKADGVSDGVLKSAMSAFDEIAGDYYIPFETFEEAMRAAITAALKEPE